MTNLDKPVLQTADPAAALAERAEEVAGRLNLLSNPKRLLIMCNLAKGESSVGALQTVVGLSQSALSQHLSKLRAAGIVGTRREAQTVYYRITDERSRILMAALYDAFCADEDAILRLREPT